jgi:hypothetical protein
MHVAAGDAAVTCVRERLWKGDIEGAREAREQAALEFEKTKENRDAELAVGIRDLFYISASLLLSQCFSWCYALVQAYAVGIRNLDTHELASEDVEWYRQICMQAPVALCSRLLG